jgi:hypothetical protein
MPAFAATALENGHVEIVTPRGHYWLTEELNRAEQILARLILSMWVRLESKR